MRGTEAHRCRSAHPQYIPSARTRKNSTLKGNQLNTKRDTIKFIAFSHQQHNLLPHIIHSISKTIHLSDSLLYCASAAALRRYTVRRSPAKSFFLACILGLFMSHGLYPCARKQARSHKRHGVPLHDCTLTHTRTHTKYIYINI